MAAQSIEELVEQLGAPSRRKRQDAAHVVALLAEQDPQALLPYVDDLLDALQRPEAQTRWELLNALAYMAQADAQVLSQAIPDAETALFDEDSSMVRLAAFKFLTALGKSRPGLSKEAWPLIDEAVQCYHGDMEFRDMLAALLDFAQGDIDPMVRLALSERVAFDAKNSATGFIRTYSEQIVDACKNAKKK